MKIEMLQSMAWKGGFFARLSGKPIANRRLSRGSILLSNYLIRNCEDRNAPEPISNRRLSMGYILLDNYHIRNGEDRNAPVPIPNRLSIQHISEVAVVSRISGFGNVASGKARVAAAARGL